jgi:ABC-type multidrug transport system fused ATPase/permease subunit
VLDEGQIIEHGTHEELIALKGFYARLFTMQKLSEGQGV